MVNIENVTAEIDVAVRSYLHRGIALSTVRLVEESTWWETEDGVDAVRWDGDGGVGFCRKLVGAGRG